MKRNRVFYLQREHLRVEREEKEGVVVDGVSVKTEILNFSKTKST